MFDDSKLYQSRDAALDAIAPYSTRAHWRQAGKGPPFVRLGKRVAYRGCDLNAWLERQTVLTVADTREAAPAA